MCRRERAGMRSCASYLITRMFVFAVKELLTQPQNSRQKKTDNSDRLKFCRNLDALLLERRHCEACALICTLLLIRKLNNKNEESKVR